MKLFFTDLDGTLLNHEGKISEGTKNVLDKWISSGNKLILSSGRPLNSILEVKEDAELNYPGTLIIANNGSLIYDCDSKTVLQRIDIPFEHVKHILNTAKKLGVHCQTYTDTHIVCEQYNEELEFYVNRIHLPCIISSDVVNELTIPPLKLLAIDIHNFDFTISPRKKFLS